MVETISNCLTVLPRPCKKDAHSAFSTPSKHRLSEDLRRVLVGVGRLTHKGKLTEYKRENPSSGQLRSMVWERPISHSIRPDFSDGFLSPFKRWLVAKSARPEFDAEPSLAFAPADRQDEFSYASEQVTHDGAISALLALIASLHAVKNGFDGPWDGCLAWADARLGELWTMRWPVSRIGCSVDSTWFAGRCASGARNRCAVAANTWPWPHVSEVFAQPETSQRAPGRTNRPTSGHLYPVKTGPLPVFGKRCPRLDISSEQATILGTKPTRKRGHRAGRGGIFAKPHRRSEQTRSSIIPVSAWTADKAGFSASFNRQHIHRRKFRVWKKP